MNLTELQKEEMRERLKKISSKKITTAMIYPLHQFELEFGHLWGYGKNPDELTASEKANEEKWDRCRNNILNNGNKQKRGLMNELDMHSVIWNRYITTFTIKEGGQ